MKFARLLVSAIIASALFLVTGSVEAGPRKQAPRATVKSAPAPKRVSQARSHSSYSSRANGGGRSPAGYQMNTGGDPDRPIQVNGQVRNMSMLLVLKNEKDQIKFIDVRRDFKDQVGKTHY